MTISSVTPRRAGPYTGSGTTGPFPFVFKTIAGSDIAVYRETIADGAEVLFTEGVDYTVGLLADQEATPGGNVTLTTALTSSYKLHIVDKTGATQGADLVVSGAWNPATVEAALDRAVMLIQKETDYRLRSLRVGETDVVPGILPYKATRASKYLAFDANGVMIASAAPSGGAVVSAFGATLIDDADAEAARRTLGVQQNTTSTSSDRTFTSADYAGHFTLTGSTARTFTFNDTCRIDGWQVSIVNMASKKLTLTSTSLGVGNFQQNASVAIFPGEAVLVRYNSAGYFQLIGLSEEVLLDEVTVSGSATGLQFNNFVNDAAFGAQEIEIANINPASAADLLLQVSTTGGSSWLTTNEYSHLRIQNATSSPTTVSGGGGTGTGGILLANALAASANNGSGRVRLHNTTGYVTWNMAWNTGNFAQGNGGGVVNTVAYDAARLIMSTGNISGTARLYGRRKRI